MITTLEGTYDKGVIKLNKDIEYNGTAKVLVVFLDEVDKEESKLNDVENKRSFLRKYKGSIKIDDVDVKKLKEEALDEKYNSIN